MAFEDVPTTQPDELAKMIEYRPGQVSSKTIPMGAGTTATLFAFAAGESVSEETYEGETLYLGVDGQAKIVWSDGFSVSVGKGEAARVPSGVEHAVEGADPDAPFKILQMVMAD